MYVPLNKVKHINAPLDDTYLSKMNYVFIYDFVIQALQFPRSTNFGACAGLARFVGVRHTPENFFRIDVLSKYILARIFPGKEKGHSTGKLALRYKAWRARTRPTHSMEQPTRRWATT
jgi:hypothetical protein